MDSIQRLFIVIAILVILIALPRILVFKKLNINPIFSLVPIYSDYLLFTKVKVNFTAYLILLIINIITNGLSFIGKIAALFAGFMLLRVYVRLARCFGKKFFGTFLLCFLPTIGFLVLGLDSSKFDETKIDDNNIKETSSNINNNINTQNTDTNTHVKLTFDNSLVNEPIKNTNNTISVVDLLKSEDNNTDSNKVEKYDDNNMNIGTITIKSNNNYTK